MGGNKSAIASKTIWTGIAILIFNLLVAFKVLPEGLTEEVVVNAVNGVLAVLAIVFRWSATEAVGPNPPTN